MLLTCVFHRTPSPLTGSFCEGRLGRFSGCTEATYQLKSIWQSKIADIPLQAIKVSPGAFIFTSLHRTKTRHAKTRKARLQKEPSKLIFNLLIQGKVHVSLYSQSPRGCQKLYQCGCHRRKTSSLSTTWWQKRCLKTDVTYEKRWQLIFDWFSCTAENGQGMLPCCSKATDSILVQVESLWPKIWLLLPENSKHFPRVRISSTWEQFG